MSLHCLKGLIKNGRIPEFTVIHENRDREKLDSKFFFPLIEYCDLNGIRIFKVKKLNELKSEISECNLGVCCGFMEIIKKDVYSLPEFGILNLHCGKLPEYRGRAPISRTIMNGDESLIISVHRIDDGVDSGDLLIEKKLRIELTDDVNTLYEKCALISGEIFCEAICELETGECNYHPQSGSSFIAGKIT
jgi:Methionyl-tRNA formyltransferase